MQNGVRKWIFSIQISYCQTLIKKQLHHDLNSTVNLDKRLCDKQMFLFSRADYAFKTCLSWVQVLSLMQSLS